MNLKVHVADRSVLSDAHDGFTLTVGKALVLSFSIAIGLAAVFVGFGVLISQ